MKRAYLGTCLAWMLAYPGCGDGAISGNPADNGDADPVEAGAADAKDAAATAPRDASADPSTDEAGASDAGARSEDARTQGQDAGNPRPDAGSTSAGATKPVATTCSVSASAAPSSKWTNATANLAGMASECGNLTLLAADPCTKRVIAGVAKSGLWATEDGKSWTQLGKGAGSAKIVHRPSSIVFDPEHPDVFYESGIYGSFADGIYRTDDGGSTFKQLGNIGHNDLVSVDFSDPARKTLLAGSHETKRKLFRSTDGGSSWTDIGMKLPADSHFSTSPLVLDAKRFLLGVCGYGDGKCGVLRSEDGGESWSYVSNEGATMRPLWMQSGRLLWTTIYDSGAIASDDLGKTWSAKLSGPRTGFPAELPDGRIAALGSDHVIVSSDGGKSWKPVGEPLPYQASGVVYSAAAKTFYIWRWDCGDKVLSDAVMSAGFE